MNVDAFVLSELKLSGMFLFIQPIIFRGTQDSGLQPLVTIIEIRLLHNVGLNSAQRKVLVFLVGCFFCVLNYLYSFCTIVKLWL